MNIAVYCGSSAGNDNAYIESAKKLGAWIGKMGYTMVYGGSNVGLMGAAADACINAGGRVIGVQPKVPAILSKKHEGISEYILTETVADRRSKMIELADAFVALPGGVGTLDEISEVLSLKSLRLAPGRVVFVDTLNYYSPMRQFAVQMISNGFAKSEYFEDVLFSDDIEEIGEFIQGGNGDEA